MSIRANNLSAVRRFCNSIRFKLVGGIFIFLVPFFLLLGYINGYALKLVRNQVADTNRSMISLYLGQIDNSLDVVNQYLADFCSNNADLRTLEFSEDDNVRKLAIVGIQIKMSQDISVHNTVDALFLYAIPQNQYVSAVHGSLSSGEAESISDYIREHADGYLKTDFTFDGWQVKKVGDRFYLLRVLKVGDICIGAWVRMERLHSLDNDSLRHSISLLVTEQGFPINPPVPLSDEIILLDSETTFTGRSNDKYLIVWKASGHGDFNMAALTPYDKIMLDFPYIWQVALIIAVVSIILMPIYFLILRKAVLQPLKHMLSAMKKTREGNLEARIKPRKTSEEFQILGETFNSMVSEIRKLKINNYEEKIARQKAELEHLQLQVKPHFFLNSLNIMNTLIRMKNYSLLQEYSQCLILYFRYMFKSNLDFVSLQEELSHVRNYLHIQQLRFPDSLSCSMDIPDNLLHILIPPLLIHTFVDNTIKYAVTLDDPIQLSIKAEIEESGGIPKTRIRISDTGPGYPAHALEMLQASKRVTDENGDIHIGIWNVQERLKMLYSGEASIQLKNASPQGAVSEILLPIALKPPQD